MCRICSGNPPDALSFRGFEKKVVEALESVENKTQFLDEAGRMDKLRFDAGDEWGEPAIFYTVRRLIFSNPDPDEGLLLFTLSCWLDMQAAYTTVWTTYLRQTKLWIDGKGPVPRGNFSHTTSHLLLTRRSIETYKGIGDWFAQKIVEIAERHGQEKGNVYRIAGEICTDLYSKPEAASLLRSGFLPHNFSGGDHKRFWMFMMFIRRDNSVIRCLFTRALERFDKGQQAIRYWYDPEFFDPIECELPVDRRVLANWNNIFTKLNVPNLQTESTSLVAIKARSVAREAKISPSVFDSMLFYSGTD